MGWFRGTPAEPFECPRGWGEISFIRKIAIVGPIFVVERRCPIGGVTDCSKCRYQINPASTELLRMQLEELDRLRGSMLSEAEFRIRRRLIIEAKDPHNPPGQGTAIAALVLGPLGLAAIGVGGYLSAAVSLGFLGLLGGGWRYPASPRVSWASAGCSDAPCRARTTSSSKKSTRTLTSLKPGWSELKRSSGSFANSTPLSLQRS